MGRGKLVFKGEEKAKKRRNGGGGNSGIKSRPVESAASADGDGGMIARRAAVDDANAARTADDDGDDGDGGSASLSCVVGVPPGGRTTDDNGGQGPPSVGIGRGLISTSSSVVMGHGTSFKSELRVGDAILVPSATSNDHDEMRVITMILSNASASISSAFSSDLKTPTAYRYINRPRDDVRDGVMRAARARREQEEVEQRAMGTYGDNKGEIVYREKTEHGGYRIRRERATTDMTRSDLLSVREKNKSDRYL